MRATGARRRTWAGAAFVLGLSAPVRAEEPPRFVVDTYDIIGGCPDEAAFREEVERRAHARTRSPMHVVVHVQQQPRSIEGTVEVIDASGGRSLRNVSSTRCAEIVSAAALVVALAIDDAAESSAPPPPPPPPPLGEVTPNVAPLTLDTGARAAVKNDDLVFRAGAQAALQTSVGPKPVLSVPLFVELGSERRHPGFHLEPVARLAWTFAASSRGDAEAGAGTASFTWMSGAVDLCPVRLAFVTIGDRSLADLRVCGRFEVGRLLAEGEGTFAPPRTESRLWLGAGVPITFRLSPRALRGVFLEAEGGPRFPLVRDRFEVGPLNSFVFRAPGAGFSGGIGAGIAFR